MNWTWLHKWLTWLWVALTVPTLLWWRESIFWIVLMSLYAIIVSHWSAWQAARAEDESKKSNDHGGAKP